MDFVIVRVELLRISKNFVNHVTIVVQIVITTLKQCLGLSASPVLIFRELLIQMVFVNAD